MKAFNDKPPSPAKHEDVFCVHLQQNPVSLKTSFES